MTASTQPPPPSARALPVLGIVGGIWGSSFLFIEVITDDTGAIETVTGRLFFGMLALAAYVAMTRYRVSVSPRLMLHVTVLAMASNIVPFALISWAQEHIESGTASVLNSTMPIFTAVFAAALLEEERFTAARITGLAFAVLGVAVLTGDDVLDIADSSVQGELAVVGAAACYAMGAIYSRRLLATNEPLTLSVLQVSLAFVISIPITLALTGGNPDFGLSPEAWLSLLALGVLGTGLAYVLYLWLVDNVGAVRASLVTYIIPVVAVFLGWLVLDESIGWNTVAGGLLIIAGVASVLRGQAPTRRPAEVAVLPAD